MNEILILTGACGVGKSTVSKAWAKAKQGAVIEADYFTEWIYKDTFKQFSPQEEILVANLCVITAKEYLQLNMPVAIENVWSPGGLDILKSRFEKEVENPQLKFVWLFCEINENHRRDELRLPENQMRNRVDIVNEELKAYLWKPYVQRIDSSKLTVSETLRRIKDLNYLTI